MEKRIEELEIKTAYQDSVIDELNSVVIEQEKRIEVLERQLIQFSRRLDSVMGSLDNGPIEDTPPPHY